MSVNKGSYALVLHLQEERRIRVGRLGSFSFPAGHYLYFGNAMNSLKGRVNRHLRADKKRRWHVDYLTAEAEIEEVWVAADGVRRECQWTSLALEHVGPETPVAGFGSSDCRGCISHLVYAPNREVVGGIWQVLSHVVGAQVFRPDGYLTSNRE